jgi:SAM-dependent methyltransferase
MSVAAKLQSSARTIREAGVIELVRIVLGRSGISLPGSMKALWRHGLPSEVAFWDQYIGSHGRSMGDNLDDHYLNPEVRLQDEVVRLLPGGKGPYRLLDVGAGPFTFLGKKHPDFEFALVAVDPLADFYNSLLKKHSVTPLVTTEKLEAERLTQRFQENTFDLVFARNCIDHSYDPEAALRQMITVVKPHHYVLLHHHPNEAVREKYYGLHQWNLSEKGGEFIIRSRWRSRNISRRFRSICSIECSYDDQGWLLTRMRKH